MTGVQACALQIYGKTFVKKGIAGGVFFIVQAFEQPPAGFDVFVVERDVRVFEVDPVDHTAGDVVPAIVEDGRPAVEVGAGTVVLVVLTPVELTEEGWRSADTAPGNVDFTRAKQAFPGHSVWDISRCAAIVGAEIVAPSSQRFEPREMTSTVAPSAVSTP